MVEPIKLEILRISEYLGYPGVYSGRYEYCTTWKCVWGGRHDISNNDRSRTKPLKMKKLPVLETYRADPPTQEWDTEIANDTTVGCKMCAFLGGHSKTAPPR